MSPFDLWFALILCRVALTFHGQLAFMGRSYERESIVRNSEGSSDTTPAGTKHLATTSSHQQVQATPSQNGPVQHVFVPVQGPQVVVCAHPVHCLVDVEQSALWQIIEQPVGESPSSTHGPHPTRHRPMDGTKPIRIAAKPAIRAARK